MKAILIRLFGAILYLYPRRFRTRFAAEMRSVFAETIWETQYLGDLFAVCGNELRYLPRSVFEAHAAEWPQRWETMLKKRILYLLGLLALALGFWLFAILFMGLLNPRSLIIAAIAAALIAFPLAPAIRRINHLVWVILGLITLASLFLPTSTVAGLLSFGASQPFNSQTALLLLSIISMALIVAAMLMFSGWDLVLVWQSGRKTKDEELTTQPHQDASYAAVITLALSMFLLARAFYNFYWFIIWDSTYDPLEVFWLLIPILAVFFASAFLLAVRPSREKGLAFLYLLVVPALIGVYWLAKQIDFRQLTEARAGHINQAIERYQTDKGNYPQNLQQLTPWYLRSIPGPVIIFGQDWCYDGGDSYYRLGYVNRLHWSDPRLTGKVYASNGEVPPDIPGMCQAEITAIQKRDPDYPYEYWGPAE